MNFMTLRAILFSALMLFPASAALAQQQNQDAGKESGWVTEKVAGEAELAAFAHGFTNHLEASGNQVKTAVSASHELFWALLGGALLAMLVTTRYLPRILAMRDPRVESRMAAAAAAAQVSPALIAEERAFSDFATEFRTRSSVASAAPPTPVEPPAKPAPAETPKPAPPPKRDPLKEFFAGAPKDLAAFRDTLQDLGRAADDSAKQSVLANLAEKVSALKAAAQFPELVPAWQMAAALEALLKHLLDKPNKLTPSTIRTVAAAADLLDTLSRPGVRPDLAQDPPIRVLAADDDPISRHAVSFALKQALNLPDLAVDGPSALKLAGLTSYDAIFLDVQMPGMDGFELCSKIRQTELNRATPVVFVTCHSDFNARAKSTLVGGQDLIGKPFLTFEVALKALTLVLRTRAGKAPAEQPPSAKPEAEAVTAAS
jgi:CheY-like chemotaxis protein